VRPALWEGDLVAPLLIDCDPGIDDAMALLLACASPEVRLLGVTTVGGNVGIDSTTRNARRVLALAGRHDVPVARGAGRPLVLTQPREAREVHGHDGVHDAPLPEPVAPLDPRHAVDLLADAVRAATEPVTLVAIGPLTNVALFYAVHPEVAALLGRLVVMGGAAGEGNVTPRAEFNAWADPDAAYRVLTEPGLTVPTTLVTMDVTMSVPLTEAHLARLGAGGAPGRTARAMLEPAFAHYEARYGTRTVAVHDAVAVAEVLRPGLLELQPAAVTVDRTDGPGRGATAVDPSAAPSWLSVSTGADGAAVVDVVVERIAAYEP
jgi:pyrimidine-specific ribonucleoside hydrolase